MKRKLFLSVIGLLIGLLINSCKKYESGSQNLKTDSLSHYHNLGAILNRQNYSKLSRINLDSVKGRFVELGIIKNVNVNGVYTPPASMILNRPDVGDQGQTGSCVSWSVGHTLVGTLDNEFPLPNIQNPRSGWFIFQVDHSNNNRCDANYGMQVSDGLNIAQYNGVPSSSSDPNLGSPCIYPSTLISNEALNNKISSFGTISSVNDIKNALSMHLPVEMGFNLYTSFDDAFNSGSILTTVSGTLRGGHAVCIIGYDDSRNAFLVQNSWGPYGGDSQYPGCLWIDYNVFSNSALQLELYVATPNISTLNMSHISIGGDGVLYGIGASSVDIGGNGIYKWINNSWIRHYGAGVAIAVEPNGTPWVVNASGEIYQGNGTGWNTIPGGATAIGIGANGSKYVIGNVLANSGGYGIFQFVNNSWIQMSGAAISIAVSPGGIPWVINSEGKIFRKDPGGFTLLPGLAKDIAIGGNGSVYILSNVMDDYTGYGIFKWVNNSWTKLSGTGMCIAADYNGTPYVVNSSGNLFRLDGNNWTQLN